MRSKLGQAMRNARIAVRLTQVQLGRRMGLSGRAVYRWERGAAVPSKRHRAALVTALQAVNPQVAEWLAAIMASELDGKQAAAAPAEAAPAPIDEAAMVERAIFMMADELDLPSRRVRGSLRRFLKSLRGAKLTLESTEQRLDEWVAATG